MVSEGVTSIGESYPIQPHWLRTVIEKIKTPVCCISEISQIKLLQRWGFFLGILKESIGFLMTLLYTN